MDSKRCGSHANSPDRCGRKANSERKSCGFKNIRIRVDGASDVWVFLWVGVRSMRRRQYLEKVFLSVKNIHKALRLVQFLASFISFYFEILSYLACGEKIIRLVSKNSLKLDEKSASDLLSLWHAPAIQETIPGGGGYSHIKRAGMLVGKF